MIDLIHTGFYKSKDKTIKDKTIKDNAGPDKLPELVQTLRILLMSLQRKLNARQKRCVLFHHSGMSQGKAYEKAGYESTDPIRDASALFRLNPLVKAELDRLQSLQSSIALSVVTETVMAPLERRQRLSEIARGRLVDFQDSGGEPQLNTDTPNNAAAREYSTRTRKDRDGNTTVSVSVKLNNPVEAIQELNKMGGDYAPSKHLIAGRVIFEVNITDKREAGGEE